VSERWGCGCIWTVDSGPEIGASPEIKYKRSKIVCTIASIVLRLGHLRARLLELCLFVCLFVLFVTQSLTGSPGTDS